MNQWQVGDVTITRIIEMEIPGGTRFLLPDATRDAVKPIYWLSPCFMDNDGNLIMSIHALVVETPSRRIVVDTCIGNDKQRNIPAWTNLQLPFLEDLNNAGYPRESIDAVLCTHLHVDHVGWNTMLIDGQWVPTFPNARYLMGRTEYEYWDTADDDPLNSGVMDDSVRPVFEAGLVDLVESDHQICDEISLAPTPGHTKGHVSIDIRSQDEHAMITGDCVHHPCQMAHTEWCSTADYDRQEAIATRESLLSTYADSDTLIIGTHFATPTAGHIRRNADSQSAEDRYWFKPLMQN
ncbi:MAG: MBL fold metallo-hydrolase [Flammeovirgaceae bacterium TMED32]|nr:MBL fold metallo-hydrolase [Gammaproteobacteria bacterium]OUU00183.1 MAG: MBL fold metallo-hydrolase [Flammeovirgaceae bacterium TMED32]OUU04284.1 MAG: MBL fold metallo-hydrolase [Flammeovirgaceae bacterium TMED32]RPG25157.1 MAG: MBL fold metallo-hydrolase [Gammaproteobacteria bacterium TMED50]|tara:strand:- start:60 stop:941 length:882 start_codon:yes stop_codon:yes gene_type:complete